jgi:hypothetical protein
METNADACFSIGKTHMVCQDYARAGRTRDGAPYAIVSDGCSSSPDTDVGARLLAIAAEVQLRAGVMPDAERTVEMLRCNLDWHGLSSRCFDATMVAALLEKTEVRVRMWGDGVVAARRRDGAIEVCTVDHTKNAPGYVSYLLDKDRKRDYIAEYGNEYKITRWSSANEDGWVVDTGVEAPLRDWAFNVNEYDLVAVLSDGVQTFQCLSETETSRTLIDVPPEEVLRELLAIRSVRGEFMKRRTHKFLTKACPPRLWHHADDLAIAAIWMGDP